MPNLPTLSVTDAQMTRLLAVFGDAPSYKAWLRDQLVAAVLAHEAEQIRGQAIRDVDARRANVVDDIGQVPVT